MSRFTAPRPARRSSYALSDIFVYGILCQVGTMHTKNRHAHGFTLVELLIVVIILAILAAIVVPQFADSANDARQSAFTTDLGNLRAVAELYRQQHGAYPGGVAATAGTCVNGAPLGSRSITSQSGCSSAPERALHMWMGIVPMLAT